MISRQLRAALAGASVAALLACSACPARATDAAPVEAPGIPDPTPEIPLPAYPSVPPTIDLTSGEDVIRDAVAPPAELPPVIVEGPTVDAPAVVAVEPSPSAPPAEAATTASGPAGTPPAHVVVETPSPVAPLRGAIEPAASQPPVVADVPVDIAVPLPTYPGPVVSIPHPPLETALRDLTTNGPLALPAGLVLSKRDREAIVAFYAERAFEPLWIRDGAATPAAQAIARQVQSADHDGLDPDAYPVILPAAGASPAVLAQAEFALSASAFAYARDARGGRLEPSRLSTMLTPDIDLPKPDEVLAGLAQAADPGVALAAYQPKHAGYVALRRKLAELRETTAAISPRPALGEGPVLIVGMEDQRVPLLRERLGLPVGDGITYDTPLSEAVRAFQRERRIPASGRLDARTIAALQGNRPASAFVLADIVANMERWRWLPRDLGERHIFVNLPEFTLRLVDAGEVIHKARVIVGKTETPTPVFSHAMDHVIVNPYWHIPPSILRKEVLPGLAADPDWAAKRGYEVIRRGNSISVRQPPGERNALGFIKFMFPNQHSVYLHDTPKRSLFATQQRAYSHGCVRVDQPFRLAEFVLGEQGFTEERMRAMIGKGERTIRLKTPLPVHLAYFTVTVDESGRLERVGDLYGHDGRIKTALGLGADGRRFAQLHRSRAQ